MASISQVLYIGITNDLIRRVIEHKEHHNPYAFTAKYRCHLLVYYEEYGDATTAIIREKELKGWKRSKKIALIKQGNRLWKDISLTWYT